MAATIRFNRVVTTSNKITALEMNLAFVKAGTAPGGKLFEQLNDAEKAQVLAAWDAR